MPNHILMENKEKPPQSIDLFIQCTGTPRPQPRPRFYNGKVISNGDKNSQLWKRLLVAEIAKAKQELRWVAPPPDVPIGIRMDFMFATTDLSRGGLPHTHKPDTDNLAKLAMDALQQMGVVMDDSCVAVLRVSKRWGHNRHEGVYISIASYPTMHAEKNKKKIKKES